MENGPKFQDVPNPEKEFHAFAETLDEQTRNAPGYERILEAAEEDGDYDAALQKLRTMARKRNEALFDVKIEMAGGGEGFDAEKAREMIDKIRLALSYPERFLGNGATAEVYTLRESSGDLEPMICAKVVSDNQRYAEGLTVRKEMLVMDELRHLVVEGVRIPTPLFSFSGMKLNGLAMEHLNAVNIRRVIEKQTTEGLKEELPQDFDVEEFARRMIAFVREMHAAGVVHNDLHLRNMMVDRVTGMPYIIDFGRAKLARELDKTKTSMEDESRKDDEALRLAIIELRQWMNERRLTEGVSHD